MSLDRRITVLELKTAKAQDDASPPLTWREVLRRDKDGWLAKLRETREHIKSATQTRPEGQTTER